MRVREVPCLGMIVPVTNVNAGEWIFLHTQR